MASKNVEILYEEHIEFIKKCFGESTDKSGVPSWQHSLNVAQTLEEFITRHNEVPDNMREDLLLGALGHDLLEDTKVGEEAIKKQWNEKVLSYIIRMTNKKGDNDTEGYVQKLRTADEEVLLIKFADILANARNSIEKFNEIRDEDWFKNIWIPLLEDYRVKLFNRNFSKYPKTLNAFVRELTKAIGKLKKRQRSKSLNIAICPSRSIYKKAITISKKLTKKGGKFTLNEKNCHPHISLYMAEFPQSNINKIKKCLERVISGTAPFKIRFSSYRQKKNGYCYINFNKDRDINELHRKIVNLLNPLREGLVREKDKVKMTELSKAQQENIRLYGYRNAGSQFDPHITLTKLENFTKNALSDFKDNNLSFQVKEIGLFYLGEHGTCRKLVAKFKL